MINKEQINTFGVRFTLKLKKKIILLYSGFDDPMKMENDIREAM